ncbi:MAG: AAA family ATPase [Candidatus Marinimicrobia bacterium]|jgi:hypothetical protein|nr:AAA family ATPase [Candidatus Neomarinimicrobiota bacterium]MBT7357376.1 AAA family ATPase [Candidatus Neomarinimicrobiota bacterium]
MKSIKRSIENALSSWKTTTNRKVLMLRGARQVGKTFSIRKFGQKFDRILEVNFDDNTNIHSLFGGDMDVQNIIQTLSVQYNIPIIEGTTLVFFDEIQACPNAIRSLRYFYEKMPDLHVVAAGSLLEFALEEIPSFGVGRIQTLFMYPLTYHEFLSEIHPSLPPIIDAADSNNPLENNLHQLACDYFKTYQIIGGMPEVVSEYLETGNYLNCTQLLDNLVQSFQTDFAKYKKRSPLEALKLVFQSIAKQAGNKFIYKHVAPELEHKTIKSALQLLLQAGLIYKIHHSGSSGIPLGSQINPKKFKILPFDSGIYQRLLGLNLKDYFLKNNLELINKGSLAEVTAGIQLMHHQSSLLQPQLYYWHREAKSSNAEIDYIIQQDGNIIPIEVKAGTKGQMQSMFLFLNSKNLDRGIRLSLENYSRNDRIENIPLYAIKSLLDSHQ